jgi:3-hydroxyacyl-[acyl-carrier-protein] dehydratase
MLRDTFFSILKLDPAAGAVKALLSINKDHDILKGHFPGQPVVPGVCMMQMVTELIALHTQRQLRVREADNMKFLAVIDPRQHSQIEASISFKDEAGNISINASLFSGDTIFFKLKATLQDA